MCRQRATQILQGAEVTSFDGWHLDACNCSLQLTGDLILHIWHLVYALHV